MTEAERNAAYHETFTSSSGAAVLENLRADFYDVVCYVPGVNMTAEDTIFHEGQRSIVEMILARLRDHVEGETAVLQGTYI